jgi:hypothetical protein
MIVFGGHDGTCSLGDLHLLNMQTFAWSKHKLENAPRARHSHTACVLRYRNFSYVPLAYYVVLIVHIFTISDIARQKQTAL